MEPDSRRNFMNEIKAALAVPGSGEASDSSPIADIIMLMTSDVTVFSFVDAISLLVEGGVSQSYVDQLELFASGTWLEYKGKSGELRKLDDKQIQKLKQLTLLTLAAETKVISYNTLMEELEFSNVHELELFLVQACINTGIIEGNLDGSQQCLKVHSALARDPKPELKTIMDTTEKWLAESEKLEGFLEAQMKYSNDAIELEEYIDVSEKLALIPWQLKFKCPKFDKMMREGEEKKRAEELEKLSKARQNLQQIVRLPGYFPPTRRHSL